MRRVLVRRGRWPDDGSGRGPFAAQEPLFAQTVAASLQGRVAFGPRAGQLVRRLRSAAAAIATGRRSARLEGFSLHADVAVRHAGGISSERLCRYLLRPPLAVERLTESTDGVASPTPRLLGVTMKGIAPITTVTGIYFHSDLGNRVRRPALLHYLMNSRIPGGFIAVDGRRRWVFHLADSQMRGFLDRGYRAVKMKVGRDDPEED